MVTSQEPYEHNGHHEIGSHDEAGRCRRQPLCNYQSRTHRVITASAYREPEKIGHCGLVPPTVKAPKFQTLLICEDKLPYEPNPCQGCFKREKFSLNAIERMTPVVPTKQPDP